MLPTGDVLYMHFNIRLFHNIFLNIGLVHIFLFVAEKNITELMGNFVSFI